MSITPDNTVFIVLSFEGPDVYSMAGGLGSRISSLTNALADSGFEVHHIFVGDPGMRGTELRRNDKLFLHRWCQWISRYHPGGVYDDEEGKINDFNPSVPTFVVHGLAEPAISQGKLVIILGEEWHTAEVMWRISDLLHYSGLRDRVIMFWNANNTYGFERIDWKRLAFTTTITTVSKYMKQTMNNIGINPLVIPNGISSCFLEQVDARDAMAIRESLGSRLILSKVARWHPDKGWKTTVHAIDRLKKMGKSPMLIARGGVEAYGKEIAAKARHFGLTVRDVLLEGNPTACFEKAALEKDFSPYFEAISRSGPCDILNIMFPIPPAFLKVIYRASDFVLANSAFEPFGLVGLEAMASGSVVFTGSSGEDYANHMFNAIVLDTFNDEELVFYVDYLLAHGQKLERIAAAAKQTAQQYAWEEVIKTLISKLEYQSLIQGIVLVPERATPDYEQAKRLNRMVSVPV